MLPRFREFCLFVCYVGVFWAAWGCQKETTLSPKDVATRFVTTRSAEERLWLSSPDLSALLKEMKGAGFQPADAFEMTKKTGDEKQKRILIKGVGMRKGPNKGASRIQLELSLMGDHWKVSDVSVAKNGRMVSFKMALALARAIKRAMKEPFDVIARQKVGGLEMSVGRAKRQTPTTYKLVFAYQSKQILEHEITATNLKRLHTTRLGSRGEVIIAQHFQRPAKLPLHTTVMVDTHLKITRKNALECVGTESPDINQIQEGSLPKATGWKLLRAGRFADKQIELRVEPNKRTVRRFQMGDQTIFFNRMKKPTTSAPVASTEPQRFLMLQGVLEDLPPWKGLSEKELEKSFYLWVDDRAANFARKRFVRKKGRIYFSLYTYNSFPRTPLDRFQVCTFPIKTQKEAQRRFVFKELLLK
ncbi:MAG: hypothetical protein H6728_15325 [Myxococcales bacterium]|nr:hypothetical protein [Myxococcales bacterium]